MQPLLQKVGHKEWYSHISTSSSSLHDIRTSIFYRFFLGYPNCNTSMISPCSYSTNYHHLIFPLATSSMITKNPPWAPGRPGQQLHNISRHSFSIKFACAVASILAMGAHPAFAATDLAKDGVKNMETDAGRFGDDEGGKPLRLLHEQLHSQGSYGGAIKDSAIKDDWMVEAIIAESDETNVGLGLEMKDGMNVGSVRGGRTAVSEDVAPIYLFLIQNPNHLTIICHMFSAP